MKHFGGQAGRIDKLLIFSGRTECEAGTFHGPAVYGPVFQAKACFLKIKNSFSDENKFYGEGVLLNETVLM
jgi:hypothetical protein